MSTGRKGKAGSRKGKPKDGATSPGKRGEDERGGASKVGHEDGGQPPGELRTRKESQLLVRVDRDLRDAFVETCRSRDTSASREIRRFMRRFLASDDS